jgi:hypothetical protein
MVSILRASLLARRGERLRSFLRNVSFNNVFSSSRDYHVTTSQFRVYLILAKESVGFFGFEFVFLDHVFQSLDFLVRLLQLVARFLQFLFETCS